MINEKVSLKRNLAQLALPIFVETLLVTLMGGVDTFMLSQYSDNAVGAVGLVNQLVVFAFLVFQIINVGTSVLCSQYIGAGQRGRMVQVTGVAMVLNLLLEVKNLLKIGLPSAGENMSCNGQLACYADGCSALCSTGDLWACGSLSSLTKTYEASSSSGDGKA